MTTTGRPFASAGPLILLALFTTVCAQTTAPEPSKPTLPAAPEPAVTGTFVAGVFQKFMRLGTVRLIAKDDKHELFVGRFDAQGRTKWLKSYRTIPDHRSIAFLPAGNRLIVTGIFNDLLDIDGKQLRAAADPRKDTLFFVTFDEDGQLLAAKPLANGRLFATPELEREGDDVRIKLRTAGGFDVPERPVEGSGDLLSLRVSLAGTIVDATRSVPTSGPPTPVLPARKASLGGAGGGYMLAALMQASCDFCEPGNGPWYDGDCSSCVGEVMNIDFDCWAVAWDWQCMAIAQTECTASTEKCVCQHGTCSTGGAMQPFCSVGPTNRPACVNTVDGRLDNCYKSSWNSSCVSEAQSACTSPGCF